MVYTKKQIAECIKGFSERLVAYYTDRGIVNPELDQGAGRGKVRRYSDRNLFEFAVIRELTRYGMSFPVVEGIMSILRGREPKSKTVRGYIKPFDGGHDLIGAWPKIAVPMVYIAPTDNGFEVYATEGIMNPTKVQLGSVGSCLILDLKRISKQIS